jgi:hypothetical protein
MRYGNGLAALAGAAVILAAPMALAQLKTTNQGISDTTITIGTHQDLSGPEPWRRVDADYVLYAGRIKRQVEPGTNADFEHAASCRRHDPVAIRDEIFLPHR